MRAYFKNIGYFLKETKTIFQLNWISNIFTLLSTGLIFFILATVISSWWISNQVIEIIQEEAEINVYFNEDIENIEDEIIEQIRGIKGVRAVKVVNEDEAYDRMAEVLGKEARVLEFLDDNPFSPFIEVQIYIDEMDTIMDKLNIITGIEYIRDNREVLDRVSNIANILKFIGYLVITVVTISTIVIISHIIRLGIYNNREQINTLALLGAPKFFISFPYLLEGLLLTVGGGILAVVMTTLVIKYIYARMMGPLPFIPLPPVEILISNTLILIIAASTILGIVGSLIGLASIGTDYQV